MPASVLLTNQQALYCCRSCRGWAQCFYASCEGLGKAVPGVALPQRKTGQTPRYLWRTGGSPNPSGMPAREPCSFGRHNKPKREALASVGGEILDPWTAEVLSEAGKHAT